MFLTDWLISNIVNVVVSVSLVKRKGFYLSSAPFLSVVPLSQSFPPLFSPTIRIFSSLYSPWRHLSKKAAAVFYISRAYNNSTLFFNLQPAKVLNSVCSAAGDFSLIPSKAAYCIL